MIDISVIIIAVFFIAMLDSSNMGIYFDSVFPDYLSVQILNPSIDNPTMNLPYIGIPFLGQLYHGTITVFLQMIVVGVLGEASLFSLRLCNAIWCSLACISMYLLLKKLDVKRIVILYSELCLIFSISLFMVLKTQYYIKVPGTAFTFFAILSFACGKQKVNGFRYALLSGFLAGLAFYSYFIYLFFVPAYIYLYIKERNSYYLFSYLGGFFIGCIGYFLGYSSLLLYILNIPNRQKKNYMVIIAIMLLFITILFIWITYKNIWFKVQEGGVVLSVIELLLIAGGSIFASIIIYKNDYVVKEYFSSLLNSLNVSGYKTGMWGRIKALAAYTKDIFSDACETRVLGKQVSIFPEIFLVIAIIFLAYLIHKELFDKVLGEKNKNIIKGILAFLISYYCMALIFATRIGIQHFVPIYFFAFFIMGYTVSIILKKYEEVFKSKLGIAVCLIAALFPMEINFTNLLKIHYYLVSNGCVGYFTTQINELAYEALKAHNEGEEELYIFPEWGIMAGFNYLTNNQINYALTLDSVKQSRAGKNVRLCYFNADNTDQYIDTFTSYGIENINMYEYPPVKNGSYIKIIELKSIPKRYALGETLDFGECGKGFEYSLGDVYSSEGWGVWIGKNFEMELIIDDYDNTSDLIADISYQSVYGKEQDICVFVNNTLINTYNTVMTENIRVEIPSDYIDNGNLRLKLECPKASSPKDDGVGEDLRELSIALTNITISLSDS